MHRRMPWYITTWSVALAALCAAVGLPPETGAQEEAEPTTDFFETVEVNVVNVEVYVTDKKGEPVTGLTAEDFEIYEDGEPMEITNFYVARGEAAATPEIEVPAAPAAEPAAAGPDLPPPDDQQLNVVLFIDNLNIRPASRNRVLDALRGSLFFQLGPGDRVMLASFNGGAVEIRQGLTGDPDQLVPAIEELIQVNPRGAHSQLDRLAILRELQQTDLEQDASAGGVGLSQGGTIDWEGMRMGIQAYAEREYQKIARTVDVLTDFVDALSGIPGRKALIYVSDGLSLHPGEALLHAWDAKSGGGRSAVSVESLARDYDATGLFEDLGRHANANRVTFYTVLASGGQAATLTPAERSAFFSLDQPTTLGQVWNERLEAMETSNLRGSMKIMADATGGLATLSTTAIGSALQRLRRDFETYYSLGYVPPDPAASVNHKIKVKARDKSLRVRHREGYRARTTDERMTGRVQSALMFDSEDNPLGVVVGFGDEKKDEKGRYLVPITVKFPIANLLLLPQEHFHEGRVSIFVGARDSQGGTSPIQKMPAPIRIPNDKLLTALAQVAGFRVTLMMNEGEHSVVVGVRDELGNVESTTRVSHTPGS